MPAIGFTRKSCSQSPRRNPAHGRTHPRRPGHLLSHAHRPHVAGHEGPSARRHAGGAGHGPWGRVRLSGLVRDHRQRAPRSIPGRRRLPVRPPQGCREGGMTDLLTETELQPVIPPGNGKVDGLTIIAWSGDLDRIWPTLILSTTAAASGMQATVFFTFWGL